MSPSASPFLQLLNLAKVPSRRAELLRMLVDIYAENTAEIRGNSRAELDAILSALVEAAPEDQRRATAERLAPLSNAPPALMRNLAEDNVTIAAPVLMHSRAIDKSTLHEIARTGDDAQLAFIAQREDCSSSLSAILADRGGEATLVALAQNQRADLQGSAMDVLTARARKHASLHEPMVARLDLPPLTLTRLYFFVAPKLKKELLRRTDIIEPILAASAASANRKSVLLESGDRMDGARAFFRKAIHNGKASPDLLYNLLKSGPSSAFVVGFAHYAGVEIDAARIILSDRRREALAIACRANEAPRPFFAKLLFGISKAQEEQAQAARILDLYLNIPNEAAERLMRIWRVRGRTAAPGAQTSPLRAAG